MKYGNICLHVVTLVGLSDGKNIFHSYFLHTNSKFRTYIHVVFLGP